MSDQKRKSDAAGQREGEPQQKRSKDDVAYFVPPRAVAIMVTPLMDGEAHGLALTQASGTLTGKFDIVSGDLNQEENEEVRTAVERVRRKELGWTPGATDVIVPIQRKEWHRGELRVWVVETACLAWPDPIL